jgi:hypothetical protein
MSHSQIPDLAFGQAWAKPFFKATYRHETMHGPKRAAKIKELADPVVGDRVTSSEQGDLMVKQRVMEFDLRIVQEKIVCSLEILSGPWEVLPGGLAARNDLERLRANEAALKRSIERIKSEQGVGTIVPTRGKQISPDGAISVRWDDEKIWLYYRNREGGKYPLCRVMDRSCHEPRNSGREGGTVLNAGNSKHAYTLILGLNAITLPGEAGRLAAAARRKALLRKFILRMQHSFLSKVFQKWRRYRRPRNFCLITLKPLGLECEDSGNIFFHPAITELLQARPRKKPTEHWQRVLVENSNNTEWLQSKQVLTRPATLHAPARTHHARQQGSVGRLLFLSGGRVGEEE